MKNDFDNVEIMLDHMTAAFEKAIVVLHLVVLDFTQV